MGLCAAAAGFWACTKSAPSGGNDVAASPPPHEAGDGGATGPASGPEGAARGTASRPLDASDDATGRDLLADGGASARATATQDGGPSRESADGMLLVPAGPFVMGADRGGEDDEHPAHTVTLPSFWLDRTEVTNAAYAECVAAKACEPSSASVAAHGKNPKLEAKFHHPAQPVCGVSWDNATAYCAFRGKRLPHEAEFEKASRDTDGRRFPWGDDPPTPERAAFGRVLGADATDDVGSHPAGRGPYGHDDLGGNVWEWMFDFYDPYAYRRPGADKGEPGTCAEIKKTQDELRASGQHGFTGKNPIPKDCEHVLRGGAYNYDGPGLRSSNRVHHPGRFRLVMAGFRCAKDATP